MRKEISEEAKRAIADVARRKAADRLNRDGAHSMDAIRRRVRAIAQERNLQPADIAKMMHKRISTTHSARSTKSVWIGSCAATSRACRG
jgi:hypothetical protein